MRFPANFLWSIWPMLAMIAATHGAISHAADGDPVQLLGADIPAVIKQDAPLSAPGIEEGQLDALFELPASNGIDALVSAQAVVRAVRGAKEVGINRKIAPATVFIQQGKSTCTGTLVGMAGEVLTCWHCVHGKGEIVVRLHPASGVSKLMVAEVIKSDPNADLALLKLPVVPKSVAPVALAEPADIQVGADVYAVGHPASLNWSFVKGIISQVYEKRIWNFDANRHEAEVIQSQIPLYPGNSGGPLVSEKSLLIGVSAGKQTDGPFTFAVSVQEVRRFLGDTVALSEPVHSAQATCKRRKLGEGRSTDNSATVMLYDTDCDGKIDTALSIPDDPAKPLLVARSSDGSGQIDAIRVGHKDGQSIYIKGNTGPIRIEWSTVISGPKSGH
jgi:S1-C subfamily serine protease